VVSWSRGTDSVHVCCCRVTRRVRSSTMLFIYFVFTILVLFSCRDASTVFQSVRRGGRLHGDEGPDNEEITVSCDATDAIL